MRLRRSASSVPLRPCPDEFRYDAHRNLFGGLGPYFEPNGRTYPFEFITRKPLTAQGIVQRITLCAASDHPDVTSFCSKRLPQEHLVVSVAPGYKHQVAVFIDFQPRQRPIEAIQYDDLIGAGKSFPVGKVGSIVEHNRLEPHKPGQRRQFTGNMTGPENIYDALIAQGFDKRTLVSMGDQLRPTRAGPCGKGLNRAATQLAGIGRAVAGQALRAGLQAGLPRGDFGYQPSRLPCPECCEDFLVEQEVLRLRSIHELDQDLYPPAADHANPASIFGVEHEFLEHGLALP